MKELYLTPETLAAKTAEMLQQVGAGPRRPVDRFDPRYAALLVLDMQDFFLDSESHACVPSARAIVPTAADLAERFRAAGRPVVLTRHVNTAEDAAMMGAWWRDVLGDANPLSRLAEPFDSIGGTVMVKSQYDAFHGTPLDAMLRDADVRQVVVAGVMTNLCCETTARAAFVRGFEVFFPVDATAAYAECYHRATLLNLAHGFAVTCRAADLIARLEGRDDG